MSPTFHESFPRVTEIGADAGGGQGLAGVHAKLELSHPGADQRGPRLRFLQTDAVSRSGQVRRVRRRRAGPDNRQNSHLGAVFGESGLHAEQQPQRETGGSGQLQK